jgi:hypothetical protein
LRRSAGVRYGAGCTKMPFDPGITAVGYSHATRIAAKAERVLDLYAPPVARRAAQAR